MFKKLIENNRVPHAILLAGRSRPALEREAHTLAFGLSDVPDLFEYRPEGKVGLHTIERMRELKEEVYLPAYQHDKKVFVIYEADRMLPQAANALLKTFEEPAPGVILILTTMRREKILPTILSRCQTFWVAGKPTEEPFLPVVETFLSEKKYLDSRPYFANIKAIAAEYEKEEDPLVFQEAAEELWKKLEVRHPQGAPFLEEARLKMSRSTSFHAILESLFIKLGYL